MLFSTAAARSRGSSPPSIGPDATLEGVLGRFVAQPTLSLESALAGADDFSGVTSMGSLGALRDTDVEPFHTYTLEGNPIAATSAAVHAAP
jgi:hypothetical protein